MPLAGMEFLPLAAQKAIEQFDPDLAPKLLLVRRKFVQDRMDALEARYIALKSERDDFASACRRCCPHRAENVARESDGDFHRPRWEYRCTLCDAYVGRPTTQRGAPD